MHSPTKLNVNNIAGVNSKECLLISYLLEHGDWVTASNISEYLNVSCRSINNYVSQINHKYNQLILSSNQGYSIQREKAIKILNSIPDTQIPRNYNERKKYIYKNLLLSHQNLTLEDLSDAFCISPSTLQNEISRLRADLSEYQLHLRIKNDKLSIIGSDRKLQELITNLIYEELENFSFSLDKMQRLFIKVDLKDVREIVLRTLKQYDYFLDDYSLLNYVLQIAVLVELETSPDSVENEKKVRRSDPTKVVTPHVNQIIQEIYNQLCFAYSCNFKEGDFFEISLPVMTNAVTNRVTSLQLNQLSDLVGQEVEELLYEIVKAVRDSYSIDLREDKFLIRFAYHLKNVVMRAKNNISVGNNKFIKVKSDFPLIYVVAVFVAKIIKNKINRDIPKDEIAYIALHIGTIMEEKKAYSEKLRCIVLAPGFNTVNRTLYQRLNSIFSDNLIITNFIASSDDLPDTNKFDLFLSTIEINPLEVDPKLVPIYLQIDQFLSETSIKKIYKKIEEVKEIKIKETFLRKIKFFFHEDLFFFNYPFQTHEDAIETICDRMEELNYVDSKYKEEIYEHERIASSAYGNIAIPHPLSNRASSSVIAISINPNPIEWCGRKTNLVFMLSLEEKNRHLFREIFDFIMRLISNNASYANIMNACTYEEFINVLVSFASK